MVETGKLEFKDLFSKICRQCRRCCQGEGRVYLNFEEARRISGFLQEDFSVFVEKFCTIAENRLTLKSKFNQDCIFLEDDGCRIYPVRPQQCRDFPFKWQYEGAGRECLLIRLGWVEVFSSPDF